MIHFIHLFKLHDFEVGVLFVSDKSWGNWTVSLQETLALLEELRSSGYYPDGGCLHAARLAAKEAGFTGKSGQGGRGSGVPSVHSSVPKECIISPSPRQTCTSWRTAWQWSFQTFRGNGVDGSPVSGYSLMHLHRRSSQRQEPCAPKVPGREDICRCQLVWQLHVEIWIYKSSTPSSLEIYWIFVFIQFHSPCNQDGTLR